MQGLSFRPRWAPAYLVAIVGIQYAFLLWVTLAYLGPWATLSWDRRLMALWGVAGGYRVVAMNLVPFPTGDGRRFRREEIAFCAVFNDAIEQEGIWTQDAFRAGVRTTQGLVLGLAGPFSTEAGESAEAERIEAVLNSVPGFRPLAVRKMERVDDYRPGLRQLAIWCGITLLASLGALVG